MWNLYEKDKNLKPLVFSNGKNQEDIVKEISESIKSGCKVIFIKGICGTGKSAIALNLAKEFGRTSIVVPVRALQKQYEDDYTNKKYLLKENKEKLKIKVITGRQNHSCPYIKENIKEFENSSKTERDSKLIDFNKEKETIKKAKKEIDFSCDNSLLPCKIELKEKNKSMIMKYLKKNPKLKNYNFLNMNYLRRMSIAPVCPYWSPIIPEEAEVDIGNFREYDGLNNIKYKICQRKKGCGYYDQFNSYIDADVIIFNSQKYKIEMLMNRKPLTEIEIIDECDEFLDSFSNQKAINLNRLYMALGTLYSENAKVNEEINNMAILAREITKDEKIEEQAVEGKIIPLKETKIHELLRYFLDNDLMNVVECDEENYCYHCDEVARTFEHFADETYVTFEKDDRDIFAKIVTINLEKRFKEMLDKSKVIVMMSGTIHSEKVLKDIFGLKDFKIIEAETKMPGKITKQKIGYEIDCKYTNFQQKRVSREQYLRALSKCIEHCKKPALVHVNSFNDLPTENENKMYNLDIMTQEKLSKMQYEDKTSENIKQFKEAKTDILYSTKCNRGVDFPGDVCNSIILTKYPYPNISSPFWRILKKTKPQYYDEFYIDKSAREFLQRIYRGLRSENDHIFLLSPDTRVLNTKLSNSTN